MSILPEWQNLQKRAFNMSCEDQERLARAIAANIGYELMPESNWQQDQNSLEARVTALERFIGKRME